MKYIYSFLLLYTLNIQILAQDFVAPIVVTDTLGLNADTVWVGYATDATFEIDSQYGEVAIDSLALSIFDIRLGEVVLPASLSPYIFSFDEVVIHQSKIDIVPKLCHEYIDGYRNSHTALFIPNNLLPVDITWDSSLFLNECVDASLITDWRPDAWWDIEPSNITPGLGSVFLRTNSNIRVYNPTGIQVVNENMDTMSLLHVFLNSSILNDIEETQTSEFEINYYPNPVSEYLYIDTAEKISEYKIYSNLGQILMRGTVTKQLDVSDLPKGIYYLQLLNQDLVFITSKFIKE